MIFLAMHFPISGTDISPAYLVIMGFLIGVLGGFFGVGGSFMRSRVARSGCMEFCGRYISPIVGKSVVAVKRLGLWQC
jgi:hypothetical protein